MAIKIYTQRPKTLLNALKQKIKEGEVATWECDNDGDFTHVPKQWHQKAWLTPSIQQNVLAFKILGQEKINLEKVVYGVYHGRFIEMVLTHFGAEISKVVASPQKR